MSPKNPNSPTCINWVACITLISRWHNSLFLIHRKKKNCCTCNLYINLKNVIHISDRQAGRHIERLWMCDGVAVEGNWAFVYFTQIRPCIVHAANCHDWQMQCRRYHSSLYGLRKNYFYQRTHQYSLKILDSQSLTLEQPHRFNLEKNVLCILFLECWHNFLKFEIKMWKIC